MLTSAAFSVSHSNTAISEDAMVLYVGFSIHGPLTLEQFVSCLCETGCCTTPHSSEHSVSWSTVWAPSMVSNMQQVSFWPHLRKKPRGESNYWMDFQGDLSVSVVKRMLLKIAGFLWMISYKSAQFISQKITSLHPSAGPENWGQVHCTHKSETQIWTKTIHTQ